MSPMWIPALARPMMAKVTMAAGRGAQNPEMMAERGMRTRRIVPAKSTTLVPLASPTLPQIR